MGLCDEMKLHNAPRVAAQIRNVSVPVSARCVARRYTKGIQANKKAGREEQLKLEAEDL